MFPGSEEIGMAIGVVPYGVLVGIMVHSAVSAVVSYLVLVGSLLYCLKGMRRWKCYGASAVLSFLVGYLFSFL